MEINIDFEKLKNNFEKVRKITGYGQNVIPVVKANAYYFGAEKIIKALLSLSEPQKKYFVYSVDEGIRLRKIFDNIEIYVFSSLFPQENELFKKYNLIPVINNFEQLKLYPYRDIILQFNTGMNRNGIELNQIDAVNQYIRQNNFNVIMVLSHLCCSDEKNNPINKIQFNNFKKVTDVFSDEGTLRGIMATHGIKNFTSYLNLYNTCRIGKYLYDGDGDEIAYSVTCEIRGENDIIFLPVGINDGLMSDYEKNGYFILNSNKIKIKYVLDDKTILDTNDKDIIGKKAIIFDKNFKNFKEFCGMIVFDESISRLSTDQVSEVTEGQKISIRKKNGEVVAYYSQILETREVAEDGIIGYGATVNTKKGDRLAVFCGGYLDGISRIISDKNCFVYVENDDGEYIPCEIYGRISMDQTIIKIPNDKINIGARVIVFDEEHPKTTFEIKTGKTANELFYLADKSLKVRLIN
jgi:alanine racemase